MTAESGLGVALPSCLPSQPTQAPQPSSSMAATIASSSSGVTMVVRQRTSSSGPHMKRSHPRSLKAMAGSGGSDGGAQTGSEPPGTTQNGSSPEPSSANQLVGRKPWSAHGAYVRCEQHAAAERESRESNTEATCGRLCREEVSASQAYRVAPVAGTPARPLHLLLLVRSVGVLSHHHSAVHVWHCPRRRFRTAYEGPCVRYVRCAVDYT